MSQWKQGELFEAKDITLILQKMYKQINSVDISQLGDISTGQFVWSFENDTDKDVEKEPFNRFSDQYFDSQYRGKDSVATVLAGNAVSFLQKYIDDLKMLQSR